MFNVRLKTCHASFFWGKITHRSYYFGSASYFITTSAFLLQTDTFSFSCKTSLSFFCFHTRNFSESSFICLISCTRWAFIAYTCTKVRKQTLNITLNTSISLWTLLEALNCYSSITGFHLETYLNLLIKLSDAAHWGLFKLQKLGLVLQFLLQLRHLPFQLL